MSARILDNNPRFFHTGCYSKIGRDLFKIIINFGLDSRLEIYSTDKKRMLAEYKCFYFLGNYKEGCCIARALDNEVLIARLMMNDETNFGKEESDLLKHEIESFLRIFIEKLSRTIEDEDYPFFISFKDPNPPYTLIENEEPCTLKELKKIQSGSIDGKLDDPFIIAAKNQLRQNIYDKAVEVEDFMRKNLLKLLSMDSLIVNIYVDGFVGILSSRDDKMREFLEHQIDFNRLSDVYRKKLDSWKVDDSLEHLFLKVIDELEQQSCYKELVETMKELDKLTPVRFIMQDMLLFKEIE